jgi:DNA-binding transcriptional MocR family regulator
VAETVLGAVRTEARARRALAAELLPQAFGGPDSLHVWLPLDDAASPERLRLAGHERGLALVTAEAFAVGEIGRQGVRVSLGGPRKRAVLQGALKALADLAQGAPAASRLVV